MCVREREDTEQRVCKRYNTKNKGREIQDRQIYRGYIEIQKLTNLAFTTYVHYNVSEGECLREGGREREREKVGEKERGRKRGREREG